MMTLDDILSCVRKCGTAFSVHGSVIDTGFTPASLSAIVDNGIYYDTRAKVSGYSLKNSILFLSELSTMDSCLQIVTDNPQLAYYKFLELVFAQKPRAGIHPSAVVSPIASIDPTATIGPFCVIEDAFVGAGVRLHSSVTVMSGSIIGENTEVEPGTVIGATGVVWCWDNAENRRVYPPQLGSVGIGKNCFIGSNVSIVRGSINEATLVGNGVVMAHGTKVGHGCVIRSESHLANNVTLGGNVDIGERSFLGSGCVIRPSVKIPRKTTVGCGAVVTSNFEEQGLVVAGVPARPVVNKGAPRLAGVPDIRGM